MKLLLHVCCGPCTIYPVSVLRQEGITFTSFFSNPNIHPFKEFRKRLKGIEETSKHLNFDLVVDKNYGLKEFLRKVVFNENDRCSICYELRLLKAAEYAAENGFNSFTTTLLYSRYQNHDLIRKYGSLFAEKYGLEFYYRDFREGWQYGIDQSKSLDIYRQSYCGCIFSEQEAFDKKLRKKKIFNKILTS
jgi:hypothetical protein